MQSFKYYGLGFAVVVVAVLVSTGLQIAAGYLPAGQIASTLIANLSGITIGSIIMVIGFLRDNRLEQERQRTEQAQRRADAAEARVLEESKRAETERERAAQESARAAQESARADQERERIDRLMGEMNAVHQRYADATEAIIKRMQELDAREAAGSQPDK